MTDENKAPETPTMADEQVQLLRSSLIQATFAKYHELVNILKRLPIQQGLPGVVQAYLFIDSGMLWFKEILNTAPLAFSQAPVAPPIPSVDAGNDVSVPESIETPQEQAAQSE